MFTTWLMIRVYSIVDLSIYYFRCFLKSHLAKGAHSQYSKIQHIISESKLARHTQTQTIWNVEIRNWNKLTSREWFCVYYHSVSILYPIYFILQCLHFRQMPVVESFKCKMFWQVVLTSTNPGLCGTASQAVQKIQVFLKLFSAL